MIRVLRLLEYVYPSAEQAEQDMQKWGVPAIGSIVRSGIIIRSSVITDLDYQQPDTDDERPLR